MRERDVDVWGDPVKGLEEARRRTENWHELRHHQPMSSHASGVRPLDDDGRACDPVGVLVHDDLASDDTATVRCIPRVVGRPHGPAEGEEVTTVDVSGPARVALPQEATVAATHDEVDRRAVRTRARLGSPAKIPHSSGHRSAVPAMQETLQSAHDKDLAELSTSLPGDAPPTLSETRLPEGLR